MAGGEGEDATLDFLWLWGLVFVAVILLWYFGKPVIIPIIFRIRLGEIFIAKFGIEMWSYVATPLHIPSPSTALLTQWQDFIYRTPGVVDFKTISTLSQAVGVYIRYPIILILGLCAIKIGSSGEQYKTVYNVKALRQDEQKNWPQIAPVVNLDLGSTDLDEKPWASALNPIKFCHKYNILFEEKEGPKVAAKLLRGPAYRVLSLQLGPEWRGTKALPPHTKALLALFLTRIGGDKKTARKFIDQFAISSAHGKLNMSGVDEAIKKYEKNKTIAKIINLHAYITTVMASLLTEARATGVLASAEFIWLKPLDRRLWYMMNCVGRTTPFAEICGAFAHWLAEKRLGLPLTIPMVEEGVNGLEAALKDILYKPNKD